MAVDTVVVIAIALAGFGSALLAATLVRRAAPAGPAATRVVPSPEMEPGPVPTIAPPVPDTPEVAVNRRIFMNRAMLLAMSVFGIAFGGTIVGFMWPNRVTGFGSKVNAGKRDEILAAIMQEKRPFYSPEGRFYIVTYTAKGADNMYVQEGLVSDGLMALYQKCAHLGCRVPFCDSSRWFECPCHGSKYNFAGEVMPGSPAPTGLWRFPMELDGDSLIVDTSKPMANPAKGVDTLREPPSGPHCV